MRKLLAFLLLTSTISLHSVEIDWGGALQNSTDASSVGELSLTQTDSLSLWMELNVLPMFNFKASGGYRFSYDGSLEEDQISHTPEFGAFYAYGSNREISWKAGRFSAKDKNGNLFNTIWDGGEFRFRTNLIEMGTGVGFTGLVFSDNSTVLMTSRDYRANSEDDALLASPRLAEYLEASFYILPGDGAVTAAFLAQQDFRADSSLEAGEAQLHSFYLNLGLKGRLGNSIFYNVYGTGEAGIYNMPVDDSQLILLAGAGGLKLDVPLNLPLKPFISADLYYSTGAKWSERTDHYGSDIDPADDYLYAYTPFSDSGKGYIYNIRSGNLFYGDVTLSISPLSFLSIAVESLTLFRSVDGPVSVLPVTEDDSSSSLFLGEEITLAVNMRPLSDVGFQLKGGVFIPNDSVVANGIQYKFGGFLSLSF